MAERHEGQKSTDGLRDFANYIEETVELLKEYGDLLTDDLIVAVADNDEDPYVIASVQQNELIDIYISEDALTDFPDNMELSTLITSTILRAFLTYQSERRVER